MNNYFSDDDIKHEQNDTNIISEDESMDDETKQIIYKNTLKDEDINYKGVKKQKSIIKQNSDKKDKKNKNIMSFSNFVKVMNEEVKMSQPKKFISKRVEDKKKSQEIIVKRHFNPRFPPLMNDNSNNVNILNLNDESSFPQIKKS
jgi:hypothetical protein